jgi:hypothetical protein
MNFGKKGAVLLGKRGSPFGEKGQSFWGKGAVLLGKRGSPFREKITIIINIFKLSSYGSIIQFSTMR